MQRPSCPPQRIESCYLSWGPQLPSNYWKYGHGNMARRCALQVSQKHSFPGTVLKLKRGGMADGEAWGASVFSVADPLMAFGMTSIDGVIRHK